jgi:hypothetical protein
MSVVMGLGVGLACSLVAILVNRLGATVLMVAPVIGWFVMLAIGIDTGLTSARTTELAFGLLGILLGLAIGQVLDRRDHPERPSR